MEGEGVKKRIAASQEFWISALANGSRELKNKQQIKHYTQLKSEISIKMCKEKLRKNQAK